MVAALVAAALLAIAPATASADAFQDLSLLRLAKPTRAADFSVPGLAGGTVSLQEHRSSVVFLNFWATWCAPCKDEMPSMERLYRRFRGRGFTILAISMDMGDPGKVAAFVKVLGLTFPVGLDLRGDVATRYSVRGLPGSFLIDRSGQIVAVAIGPRDWDSPTAQAVVESLLRP
jgi:peroxiredoxin